jgi:hypothetical protein
MTSIPRPRGSQRRSFARAGHRSPQPFAGGAHSDDWRDETLKAVVLEVAALKAHFAPVRAVDGGSGCECVALRQRVSQLERENAALRAAHGQQRALRVLERPASSRVDRWRPTDSTPLLREYFSCRQQPWQTERGQCRLRVERGDIVSADEMWKMHFVSADMRRSRGVALRLANVFGPVEVRGECSVGVVEMQRLEQGGLVFNLLNLVTKRKYYHKPAANPERFLADIVTALRNLRDYCEKMHIRRLALPRVGSNLDRVNWRWTQRKLLEVFEDLDIELVVFLGDRRPRPARRSPPADGRPPALQQPLAPDGSSRTDFPSLGEPKERAVRPEGRQAGLHKGDGADACGGSVLAGRPEASNGPPALPEADNSANDGARASAQPSSLSQVSSSAAPNLHFSASENLEHPLNPPLVLFHHVMDAGERDAAVDDLGSPWPSVDENSSTDVERLLLSPSRSQPVVVLTPLPLKVISSGKVAPRAGQNFR